MSWNNVLPWWLLGPCRFKTYFDGSPESTDWEVCTTCNRKTRFRVELMKQCVAKDVQPTKQTD